MYYHRSRVSLISDRDTILYSWCSTQRIESEWTHAKSCPKFRKKKKHIAQHYNNNDNIVYYALNSNLRIKQTRQLRINIQNVTDRGSTSLITYYKYIGSPIVNAYIPIIFRENNETNFLQNFLKTFKYELKKIKYIYLIFLPDKKCYIP